VTRDEHEVVNVQYDDHRVLKEDNAYHGREACTAAIIRIGSESWRSSVSASSVTGGGGGDWLRIECENGVNTESGRIDPARERRAC
jgi:hypothetical protein